MGSTDRKTTRHSSHLPTHTFTYAPIHPGTDHDAYLNRNPAEPWRPVAVRCIQRWLAAGCFCCCPVPASDLQGGLHCYCAELLSLRTASAMQVLRTAMAHGEICRLRVPAGAPACLSACLAGWLRRQGWGRSTAPDRTTPSARPPGLSTFRRAVTRMRPRGEDLPDALTAINYVAMSMPMLAPFVPIYKVGGWVGGRVGGRRAEVRHEARHLGCACQQVAQACLRRKAAGSRSSSHTAGRERGGPAPRDDQRHRQPRPHLALLARPPPAGPGVPGGRAGRRAGVGGLVCREVGGCM